MADIGTAYVRIAPNMTGIQGKIAAGFNGLGNQFGNQFSNEFSSKAAVLSGAIAGVAQAAMQKAMSAISNSLGAAVSRVDTLAKFPTVMQNLGYSADEARQQVDRMAKSVVGLPTSLDQITGLATRLAPVSGGLTRATDVALAFNNAVLAGGGPIYRQSDAIEQFSQMLSKGVPDMMAWRTLQEAMPATLSQTAKALGITSGNTLELYDKLQNGTITFQQFTDAIVGLNKEGLPGFKSFADQAKDSTSGIATGMQNAQTAITRGVAKIIDAVGQENLSKAIGDIGKAFENALGIIAKAIPPALSAISSVVGFIVDNKDVFGPLAVGIIAVVTAMKLWQAATTIATAIQAAFNIVLTANPIGLIILAIVGLVAALTYFFTQTELGKSIMHSFGEVIGAVWEGIKSGLQVVGNFFSSVWSGIQNVISGVINWVKSNWPLLLGVITGPIGIAVSLIAKNWDTIKQSFQNAWNFVTGIWGKAGEFFGGIFNNIKSAFNNVVDLGRNIVEGLWNGIQGMGGWLKDKVISFVRDKIPGPIRDALGIHSPSRVAAALGKQVPAGLAQGIYKGTGMVEKAAINMANSAIATMTPSTLNPSLSGAMTAPMPYVMPAGESSVAGKADIVQNNNIYNQVDLDSVTRELAWQIRR